MKIAALLSVLVATVAASASASSVDIPAEHHERFLREQADLESELNAWKESAAGIYALEQGFYSNVSSALAVADQLARFYLTKISIAVAALKNPEAEFSTDSPFTLMTEEEFAQFVGRSKQSETSVLNVLKGAENVTTIAASDSDRRLATTVDWTTSGCVSAVRSQGTCGDCWAFSAIGALETAYCLKKGNLTQFSDQQVTSCDTQSSGCNGGLPEYGLQYIQKHGSVCTQASYPFTSGKSAETGTCTDSSCSSVPVTIAAISLVSQSESALIKAIAKQPVAVAVTAGNTEWKQYKSGVLSSCSTTTIDHAVLAVGYTSTAFTIKNQWGADWGNNGYISLKRNGANSACQVVNDGYNVYPTLL